MKIKSLQLLLGQTDDGGVLLNSLKKNGYKLEHNDKNIQVDGYACGAYSFVSLMELLRFDDIKKAVDRIGVNMSELGKEWNMESSADIVREKVVGWWWKFICSMLMNESLMDN